MKKEVGLFLLLLTVGSIDLRAAEKEQEPELERLKIDRLNLKAYLDLPTTSKKEELTQLTNIQVLIEISKYLNILYTDQTTFGIKAPDTPLGPFSYALSKPDSNKTYYNLIKAICTKGSAEFCRYILKAFVYKKNKNLVLMILEIIKQRQLINQEVLKEPSAFFKWKKEGLLLSFTENSDEWIPLEYARSIPEQNQEIIEALEAATKNATPPAASLFDSFFQSQPPANNPLKPNTTVTDEQTLPDGIIPFYVNDSLNVIKDAFTLKAKKSIDQSNFKKAVAFISEKCKEEIATQSR